MTNETPIALSGKFERPKSAFADFTADSRGIDKILEVIDDEVTALLEDMSDAPEYGSQEWDERHATLHDFIASRLAGTEEEG